MHVHIAKLPRSPEIKKSVEFRMSQIHLAREPFFIARFQGIEFGIQRSKCSPRVPSQEREENRKEQCGREK